MDASQDSSVEDSEEEEPDLEAPGSQLGEQQDLRSRLRRRAVFLEGGISQSELAEGSGSDEESEVLDGLEADGSMGEGENEAEILGKEGSDDDSEGAPHSHSLSYQAVKSASMHTEISSMCDYG